MNKAKNLDSIFKFLCNYLGGVKCFVIIKKGEIVGPRVVNIEILLSFDDEQYVEFNQMMINVHEPKNHICECDSRMWDITQVRLTIIKSKDRD